MECWPWSTSQFWSQWFNSWYKENISSFFPLATSRHYKKLDIPKAVYQTLHEHYFSKSFGKLSRRDFTHTLFQTDLLIHSAFCKVYPFRPFTDFFNYTEFSSLFKTSIGSLYYVFNLHILNIYMYLNIYTEYMYVYMYLIYFLFSHWYYYCPNIFCLEICEYFKWWSFKKVLEKWKK